MSEVLIFSENEVINEGWPPIYYDKYGHRKWQATITIDKKRFYVGDCDSSDEAIARIEQAIVEHFGVFEKRTGFGRREYDPQDEIPNRRIFDRRKFPYN